MFDVGWGELFLIGIVALIVVGPKDLPGLFRTLGQFTGRARTMARDFQRTLEAAADEAGVSEMQKTLRGVDQGLSSASDAARRFADRKLTAGDEEIASAPPKPVVRAPAVATPVAEPPAAEAVPEPERKTAP